MSTEQTTALIEAAREIGDEHGANASTWIDIDDAEQARSIIDDVSDHLPDDGFASDASQTVREIEEAADGATIMAHELPAFVDHYRETFQASFESALETRAASYLRGMPIPAALYVDGEPVEVDDPDDLGHVHVAINEDGTAAEPQPLAWCNSAGVTLTHEQDEVQVSISTGDPRGAFVM